MTIRVDAQQILARVTRMVRLVHNVEIELLADQAEAVGPASGFGHSGSATSDISDPTWHAVRALAPFAKWDRDMADALRAVDKALDQAELTFQRILHQSGEQLKGKYIDAEERCPGYTEERRARLGGCGNVLERYKTADGVSHVRSDRLCVSCRRAKQQDERNAA